MRRLLLLALLASASRAAARSPRSASPTCSRARASSRRRRPTSARRAARQHPDRGRHPRHGVEHVLVGGAQRRRRRGAPDARDGLLQVARHVLDLRACASSSTRRSIPSPTGLWSRSPTPPWVPRSGARCAPASRSCRSTPAPTCGAASGSSPTSASRRRRRGARPASGWRRPACATRSASTTRSEQVAGDPLRGVRAARCARPAAASHTFALDVEDRNVAAPKLAAEIERGKADGVLGLGTGGSAAALDAKKLGGRAARVKIGTFDLTPEVLEAIKDGRILFAVDQQAYLQGYMPIVMLTQEARYGLFPSRGEVVATGPELRDARDRVARAPARGPRDPLAGQAARVDRGVERERRATGPAAERRADERHDSANSTARRRMRIAPSRCRRVEVPAAGPHEREPHRRARPLGLVGMPSVGRPPAAREAAARAGGGAEVDRLAARLAGLDREGVAAGPSGRGRDRGLAHPRWIRMRGQALEGSGVDPMRGSRGARSMLLSR